MKDFEKENIKIISSLNKRLIMVFLFAFIFPVIEIIEGEKNTARQNGVSRVV